MRENASSRSSSFATRVPAGSYAVNNIDSLKARIASLEQSLAEERTNLQAARLEVLATNERLKRLTTQRDVAWAAARRRIQAADFQENAMRNIIAALEERVREAEAETMEWQARYQTLRARIWRMLRLSGAPLLIRLIPRPMRRVIRTTLLAWPRN